jgi:hypothetical protein
MSTSSSRFIATGVLFSGIGNVTATAEDLEQGFIDRLRSLPIPRSSVLAARAIADTATFAWNTAFTAAIALASQAEGEAPGLPLSSGWVSIGSAGAHLTGRPPPCSRRSPAPGR